MEATEPKDEHRSSTIQTKQAIKTQQGMSERFENNGIQKDNGKVGKKREEQSARNISDVLTRRKQTYGQYMDHFEKQDG